MLSANVIHLLLQAVQVALEVAVFFPCQPVVFARRIVAEHVVLLQVHLGRHGQFRYVADGDQV